MSAKRFGTRIDLQNNEILNMLFQKVNGLPSPTPELKGGVRFNTADGRLYTCDGSGWNLKATNSDALQGYSPAQLRERGTHTGDQPASSISDLGVVVKGYKISDFAAADKAVLMGNQRITGLGTGTASSDAVTKAQLDAVATIATNAAVGIAIKEPVVAAATSNINIASPPTAYDGITVPTNGRILLAGQTDATQNGIYVKQSAGALVRATDADSNGELVPGTQVYVTQGVTNGDSAWAIISDVTINIGVTNQGWTKIPGSGGSGSNSFGLGLQVIGSDVQVKPGLGILVSDGSVSIDSGVVVRKNTQAIPAGTSPVTVNHALNTSDLVGVQVRDITNGDLVEVGTTVTGANTISLDFAVNPVAMQYRVAVAG